MGRLVYFEWNSSNACFKNTHEQTCKSVMGGVLPTHLFLLYPDAAGRKLFK